MSEKNLNNPIYYENRETSWLEFNQRVLDEAENLENPLFERMKFLSIVSSNLDEFFMVRVASLKEQVNVGYDKLEMSGRTPKEQLKEIGNRVHIMVEEQYNHYRKSLIPSLRKNRFNIVDVSSLDEKQEIYIEEYFREVIYPVLTPLAVDSSRPFPLILNMSLNIATLVEKNGTEEFATVQVPAVLPRLIQIPSLNDEGKNYILLEDIIKKYIQKLFLGYNVLTAYCYRITRNADLSIDEEEAEDLLLEIEKSIKKRKWGETIRLEIENNVDERILTVLKRSLDLGVKEIFFIKGPIDLTFLMKAYSLKGYKDLKYLDYTPQTPKDLLGEEDIFEAIRKKDIMLFHPFESFEPVIELIQKASKDKNVLAIKQTLYRVSGESPIVKALADAAEQGKQVTVLVELKARFDEENNIQWARKLEQAGCHVIYGLVGLKTHSKVTLIVRKEDNGIRRYVHLGTGNYNDITARFYTDLGLLTCSEIIGEDVSAVFNTLSGYSDPPRLKKITMAPTDLRSEFYKLIRKERKNAKEGKIAKMVIKTNSLCDQEMIKELYLASIDGVEIELIVRGICSLIPKIEGISDNITVRSIVGKYLEHTRIYYFYNNGEENIYLSSADWMPRNLDRRVELLFPIESEHIKERLKEHLEILIADVVKAKIKEVDCSYSRIDRRGKKIINSQEFHEQKAMEAVKEYTREIERDIYIPITSDKEIT